MAKDDITGNSTATRSIAAATNRVGGNKPRVRKVYNHVLTQRDKFALRMIMGAKDACRELAEKVRSGEEISPESISGCVTCLQAAGSTLFQ